MCVSMLVLVLLIKQYLLDFIPSFAENEPGPTQGKQLQ